MPADRSSPKVKDVLRVPRPTGEIAERHIATKGASVMHWGKGMRIAPRGNRIFIRSNDYLWCVGDPEREWAPPEKYLGR